MAHHPPATMKKSVALLDERVTEGDGLDRMPTCPRRLFVQVNWKLLQLAGLFMVFLTRHISWRDSGNANQSTLRLVEAERLKGDLLVTFGNGKTAMYPASFHYDALSPKKPAQATE
jgi:hypothetical protein